MDSNFSGRAIEKVETINALLNHAVAAYGDASALEWPSGSLSYRQLAVESAGLAKGLVAIGAGKGTRIAVLAGNNPFWVRAFFACAHVGAILIPISTLATPIELAYILKHSDAHILLASRFYVGRDYGQTIEQALPDLAAMDGRRDIRAIDAPYLRSIWLNDTDGLPWAGSTNELVAKGGDDAELNQTFLDAIAREVTPADEAVIIYTSGSTAQPKAVLHTHGPITRQVVYHLADRQIAFPGERVLCVLPFFWVGGMTMLLNVFIKGGTVILPEGVSPQSVATALQDLGADACHGWPMQRNTVRAALIAAGGDFSNIRGLRDERLADGSPKPPELHPNSLGMTETFGPHGIWPIGSLLPPGRKGAFASVSEGFERRVVDPETGDMLPAGQTGELLVRGGSLMSGYYKRERDSTFTRDGFFATSDLVHIDGDGLLYLHGRLGDMLKTRGANVSRLEVESALIQISNVDKAFVCGIDDAVLGQQIVAAVVPVSGAELTEDDVQAELSKVLPRYKIPSRVIFIRDSDLIWTASGKLRVQEMANVIKSSMDHRA